MKEFFEKMEKEWDKRDYMNSYDVLIFFKQKVKEGIKEFAKEITKIRNSTNAIELLKEINNNIKKQLQELEDL